MPRQRGESQGSATDIFGREIPGNFRIWMRRETLAESLWEYGEDALAEQLTSESDEGAARDTSRQRRRTRPETGRYDSE